MSPAGYIGRRLSGIFSDTNFSLSIIIRLCLISPVSRHELGF